MGAVIDFTAAMIARRRRPAQEAISNEARIAALAKQWFVDMQQGKVDHSQYAPAYAAQITDGAVQAMSGNLNRYGAPPLRRK